MNRKQKWLPVLLTAALGGATLFAANLPLLSSASDQEVAAQSRIEAPSPLFAIEQNANRVVALASENRWTDVRDEVRALRQTWLDFEPLDPADVEPVGMRRFEEAQSELEAAALRQDETATILAAHEVGDAAVGLYQLFHPTIPGAIRRLEEHEGRMLMDAALGRPHSAHEVLDGADAIWHYFKPALLDHGGESLALKFQANLDLQHDYLDSHEYANFKGESEQSLATLYQIGLLF